MKAYNTSVHEKTKYIPHKLVFARSARVPTSSILSDYKGNESYSYVRTFIFIYECTIALFNRIFDAQASARENLEHAKIRFKRYYDRKTNPQVFNKDDYVYLLKELLRDKFDEQYEQDLIRF